ncbi:MAG TPA: sigma 54-interacting transcriptional regulator [Bacillota bacterium]
MNGESVKIRVENQDRVGLVYDMARVLTPRRINIRSMEVTRGVMFLELEDLPEPALATVVAELEAIPQVTRVAPVALMPHEEKEQRLLAVLESVSEGILSVDEGGVVTLVNPAAERILARPKEETIGRPIAGVVSSESTVISTLKTGRAHDNREVFVETPKGRRRFIVTTRPIRDGRHRTVGAVAAMKDLSEVRQLAHAITKPSTITFDDIIGESEAVKRAKEIGLLIADSDSTVLIRGESGTGKELFARAIYAASSRENGPFVPINCAAIPDQLLESELFGYEEGSFTGARRGGRQGLLEYASEGVVFLDEIGEMSPHLQAKLLRVLQEGRVRRIGGNDEIPVDVRVITATNRPLEEMVRSGQFREDLYYRLNVLPLQIPALRERPEDVPVLVRHFLNRTPRGAALTLTDAALRKLLTPSWPGNVRELGNVVERAVNFARAGGGAEIRPEHIVIGAELSGGFGGWVTSGTPGRSAPAGEKTLKKAVEELEKARLREAIARHGSSRKVGRALGLSHRAVLNKMKKYGLDKAAGGGAAGDGAAGDGAAEADRGERGR